nr:caspase recruitment domain-containing protein 16 isoform X3 [Macaca fascicularis]
MQATILILSLGRKIKICICMCSGCFPVCAHTLPKRKAKHTFSFSPHKKGRREEPWPVRYLEISLVHKTPKEYFLSSQLLRQCRTTQLCPHPQAQKAASSFAFQKNLKGYGNKSHRGAMFRIQ